MCAIFGWFGSDTMENLRSMAKTMSHRGPDGEGYHHTNATAIGMTRLAINDLDHGQQPFHSNDQSITAVCNGEIYNFKELKSQLTALGHHFQTHCDCEILPAAYQQWGMKFLNKLNGMFAIAILDHRSNELILARDPCGQKPLYYAENASNTYFSSEIRALHKIGVPKELNRSCIPSYLALRYVPEPDTMFQHIKILPAGSYLRLGLCSTAVEPTKWFILPSNKYSITSPIDELHSLTKNAIRDALVSDVPLALHLSAGIDSSVLLAEIQQTKTPIHALTAGFGFKSDEVREASQLCQKFHIPHTEVTLNAADISSLPRVISQMELPVGDALILAFDRLAEATAQVGCKVAIGGEGVDELFGGYSFHRMMLLAEKLGGFGRFILGAGLGLAPCFLLDTFSAFPASLGKSGKRKIQDYLLHYTDLSPYSKGINLRTLFSDQEIKTLCSIEQAEQPALASDDLLDEHLRYQFNGWMQDWAIIRQERNTMAHSVEYRMPFLDHRMIDFASTLHNSHRLNPRSGKRIWRQMAAKHYPQTQHQRTKQPFFFPTEDPAYFTAITELLDSVLDSETFLNRGIFHQTYIRQLRTRAEQTREFLPIKQLLSIAILELWMQEHEL